MSGHSGGKVSRVEEGRGRPKLICLESIFSIIVCSAHLIEDVAKAVHVQRGETVDGLQAKSLSAVTRLDTKKEARGTAENCAAVPGEKLYIP